LQTFTEYSYKATARTLPIFKKMSYAQAVACIDTKCDRLIGARPCCICIVHLHLQGGGVPHPKIFLSPISIIQLFNQNVRHISGWLAHTYQASPQTYLWVVVSGRWRLLRAFIAY